MHTDAAAAMPQPFRCKHEHYFNLRKFW